MTMTPTEYMELANRTNKDGDEMVMTDATASALVGAMPMLLEASYKADRIKAALCYGAKLKEPQLELCDASLATGQQKEMTHAALGLFSEAGEILEIFHKAYAFNEEIDPVHMAEELGDVLWFVALMAKNIGYSMEDLMAMNIDKLITRYGEKYCDVLAVNRDTEAERETLETSIQ